MNAPLSAPMSQPNCWAAWQLLAASQSIGPRPPAGLRLQSCAEPEARRALVVSRSSTAATAASGPAALGHLRKCPFRRSRAASVAGRSKPLMTARRKPPGGIEWRAGREGLVEGDLHAGHTRIALDLVDQGRRRMAITHAVGPEQHDAITAAAIGVGKIPDAVFVEPHHRFDPSAAVEIGPLIGEAQVRLNDGAADGLEVEHAGIAGECLRTQAPQCPSMSASGSAWIVQWSKVPSPAGLPVTCRHQRGSPSTTARSDETWRPLSNVIRNGRRRVAVVIGLRYQYAAADAHAFEIDDWLGKNRKAWRRGAVRSGVKPLAERHRELVIDPAVRRVPLPGVAILSRNGRGGFERERNIAGAKDRLRGSAWE